MAPSGASPRLLKKALGQISLNSPRANQPLVTSSQNKPLFHPANVSIAEPTSFKLSTAGTEDDPASEAVKLDVAMQTSGITSDLRTTSTVVEETKIDDRDENTSAVARLTAVEAGQEGEGTASVATDLVRGRPSMMVETANPRLQETSALPRGTVVRVRLFAEEKMPEMMQEETTTTAAESAGAKETEQQQDEGGHDEKHETVQPPHQQQEGNAAEVIVCAQEVGTSRIVAVPPEPAGEGEQGEAAVPALLPKTAQYKGGQQQGREMAALLSEKGDTADKSAVGGAAAAIPVIQVHPGVPEEEHDVIEVEETANVVVGENHAGAKMGKAPSSSPRMEIETTVTAMLTSQEKEENDDQAPVSLSQELAEEVVATEKAHELIEEGVDKERREGTGVDVMVPQHAGSVVDAETRSLVEESKYLQFADEERSVLCTLTGKKIAPAYDSILLYMGSRKVQQLMVEGPFIVTVSTPN